MTSRDRRKAELGQAEGGLQDEGVRREKFRPLGGEPLAQLEVARVEQRGAIAEPGDVEHGGAEDVARGQKTKLKALHQVRVTPGHRVEFAIAGHAVALLDQSAGDLGAERPAVPREMVAVGVGHEGALTRRRRIQPKIELRQVKTFGMADSDGGGHQVRK